MSIEELRELVGVAGLAVAFGVEASTEYAFAAMLACVPSCELPLVVSTMQAIAVVAVDHAKSAQAQ